jgi:hypothetical protein
MEPRTSSSRLAQTVGTAAIVVLVLGVLPFAWDADVPWRVFGPVVALLFAAHAVRLVRLEVFSTSPRHLARGR